MRLTSRGELALKAMIELAKSESSSEPGLSAAEIARRCQASVKFLEQVLTRLRAGGYVVSSRGRLGGYRLARDPSHVMVGEISRLIDGPLAPAPCASISQHRACDWCPSEAECDLKTVWVQVRDATARVMDSISLADLARRAAERRLADKYAI
jgi:Rrf2 family protein